MGVKKFPTFNLNLTYVKSPIEANLSGFFVMTAEYFLSLLQFMPIIFGAFLTLPLKSVYVCITAQREH